MRLPLINKPFSEKIRLQRNSKAVPPLKVMLCWVTLSGKTGTFACTHDCFAETA